jgi:hypothetical protein
MVLALSGQFQLQLYWIKSIFVVNTNPYSNSRYSLITGLKPKDQPGHESSEPTTSTQASTSNQTQAPTQSTAQTNLPPSTMSDPMSWESTIPGAFTWGPGGDSQRQPDHPNTDNTNSNDTANNNNSSTGESQNSSTNVLDLD